MREGLGTCRQGGNDKLARRIIALTMLGKVRTSVSDFDELYKRKASKRAKLIVIEQMRTPVPLSTTKGAEGSIDWPGDCLSRRLLSAAAKATAPPSDYPDRR